MQLITLLYFASYSMYNNTTNHGIGQIPKYSFIVYCRCEIAIYHEYYLLIVMYKVDDVVIGNIAITIKKIIQEKLSIQSLLSFKIISQFLLL